MTDQNGKLNENQEPVVDIISEEEAEKVLERRTRNPLPEIHGKGAAAITVIAVAMSLFHLTRQVSAR